MANREELERRVLALVRDYMDGADEHYPDGYDIEEFMMIYQLRVAPSADEDLQPWDGGPQPGSYLTVATSSTTRSHWFDDALASRALDMIREQWLRATEGREPAEEE